MKSAARDNADDLVQETYLKALCNFASFLVRYQFSRVDVPNPEEHVSEFCSTLDRRMSAANRGSAAVLQRAFPSF